VTERRRDDRSPPVDRPPSVDWLAQQLLSTGLPAPVRVDVARAAIAAALSEGDPASAVARAHVEAAVEQRRLLQPVINATGVLLHTNMGRAPLAVHRPAGYTNLELDLGRGQRGDRSAHAARFLAKAVGAEAALIVNNGAAAIYLVLATLATGREVIVSRGELVEIGGGFRIPEVLEASGARLVEVGTTNRTRPSDYRGALSERTGLVLKVHPSNYRMSGFVAAVGVPELAGLAASAAASPPASASASASASGAASGAASARPDASARAEGGTGLDDPHRLIPAIPVVADLGSGLLDANCPWLEGGPPPWLGDEPAVRQTLAAGASVVTFSGDKLLGGPQAGVIAGRADLVARCRRHPLARVLRPGGLVLEALQEVALAYLRGDAGRTVPLWQLATAPLDALRRRAEAVGCGQVADCMSVMGGGALPGRTIPSVGIALPGDRTETLRAASPAVLARVVDGRTVCDLRTVFPEQDPLLAKVLAE
jgi:L-seryl-tRNA(Ser) seleniumtransferase